MGGETFDLVAFSAAARDRQDAGCAEACALPVSSMISLDMEVSEETVAGICLRTLENKLPVRELRVKKVRARSTDYGAIIEILKRSPALEVLELPNLTFTDADVLDDLPRLCVSNASVSCDVAHSLVLADRKIKGLHLILTDSDEPAVALSALRNLPAISAVSLTTSSMATGAWDPFLFVLKNDIEQPWPARLNDAITESRLLQTARLELSSSALVSSGGHAVSLLRLLASGGHVRSVSLAIKLPDLRPDVLSALLAEVAGSPKVHDVAVHLTGPECALTAMAHVAAGGLGHVQHWELALAFAEGAAEAAVALVPVCAVAGVQAATLLVRGPGGTVPDGACAQLAALLARERGVAVKLGCRATAAGREALDKAGTLVRDPAE